VATRLGSELLRVLVYGAMPDVVRRRFDFEWSNADRAAFAAVCGMLRAMGPAITRGALESAFPEGTPHLDPHDPSRRRVIEAGPNPRQSRDAVPTT
jgi:hypothetical protein